MRDLLLRRKWVRRFSSGFLLFHVAAIIIAPASVEPTSPMWMGGWKFVKPYVQTLYLDQGWNFFSPEPGPSTLISYRATTSDGQVVERRLPSKSVWPRLLYHREFMITSYMGYQSDELQFDLCEGYIDHIEAKHDAAEVAFTKHTHLLPTFKHIETGGTLDHEELWEHEDFIVDDGVPLSDYEALEEYVETMSEYVVEDEMQETVVLN